MFAYVMQHYRSSHIFFHAKSGNKQNKMNMFEKASGKCNKLQQNPVSGDPDKAIEVGEVGGGSNMTVHNEELKRCIEEGRKEIKEAQEKLNSSLTTPLSESEAKVNK